MKRVAYACLLGATLFLVVSPAHAEVFGTGYIKEQLEANDALDLGNVYDTKKGKFERQRCIASPNEDSEGTLSGRSEGTAEFESLLDQRSVAHSVGLDAGGNTSFGLAKVTASVRFADSTAETANAISSTWAIDLSPGILTVRDPDLKKGIVPRDAEAFQKRCGDRYISGIRYGARLLVSMRIVFSSFTMKRELAVSGGMSGTFGAVSAKTTETLARTGNNASVQIRLRQIGGDPSQVPEVFRGENIVRCSAGDVSVCLNAISDINKYVADFSKQLKPIKDLRNAADLKGSGYTALEYVVEPYPSGWFEDAEGDTIQRDLQITLLAEEFNKDLYVRRQIGTMLSPPMLSVLNETKIERLKDLAILTEDRLSKLNDARFLCYRKDLEECTKTVRSVTNLPRASDEDLDLPALATASARLYRQDTGVMSRKTSVEKMTANGKRLPRVNHTSCQAKTGPGAEIGQDHGMSLQELHDEMSPTSAVVLVEGVGLKAIDFYFNGIYLDSKPLGIRAAQKRNVQADDGTDQTVVVIDYSGPRNADDRWTDSSVDFDPLYLRRALVAKKGMASSQGYWTFIIRDVFGRKGPEFLLFWEKWDYVMDNNRYRTATLLAHRDGLWGQSEGFGVMGIDGDGFTSWATCGDGFFAQKVGGEQPWNIPESPRDQ
ncbi:MAG: hypothetical protein ACKVQW_05330 [Pyrinomonadaceae bacterium]